MFACTEKKNGKTLHRDFENKTCFRINFRLRQTVLLLIATQSILNPSCKINNNSRKLFNLLIIKEERNQYFSPLLKTLKEVRLVIAC